MYPLDVTMPQAGYCVAGGLEFGAGIDPRIGTVRGHRPASGVRPVRVLPIRRAIARLVPSMCGTLPPREGGPHVRLSHRIVHHAMAKQLPLVIGCAVDPTLFCGLLYLSFGLLI